MSQEKIKPAIEIRDGNMKMPIWKKETNGFIRYSFKLVRRYNIEGQWKNSDFSSLAELKSIRKCLDDGEKWMLAVADETAAMEVARAA